MGSKLLTKKIFILGLAWATFLTLTMSLFESMGITPDAVSFGIIGWALLVELPRVWVGFILIDRTLKIRE